ncbi:MAG: outer membrane lipoprotein-sorting protein [Rhodobacteraceae bacterium]|nr:outer membrane lipoprotein-sorting protein [Paracoccaceae bacterium]
MTILIRSFLVLVVLAASAPGTAVAETAEAKGLRIAKAASNRLGGYGDLSVSGEMILYSKGGATSERRFDAQWVESSGGGGSRSLLVFRWPGDIRNTALLTHTNAGSSDDQWLWLPSLARVRRISSSGRSGAFVGSEFAFEDMVDQEVDKFHHTWLRDAPCPASGTCHVIDRRPRSKSGYSLQRIWVDTGHLRLQQVAYFDRRGAHLKTLTVSGYRLYQNRFWRASRMNMQNHLTGKRTVLKWRDYRFGNGLNRNQFMPNALKRIR